MKILKLLALAVVASVSLLAQSPAPPAYAEGTYGTNTYGARDGRYVVLITQAPAQDLAYAVWTTFHHADGTANTQFTVVAKTGVWAGGVLVAGAEAISYDRDTNAVVTYVVWPLQTNGRALPPPPAAQ